MRATCWYEFQDCDDEDFERAPDKPEKLDDKDNDCDNLIDENFWYLDSDYDDISDYSEYHNYSTNPLDNDSDDDVPISFLINTVLNPWLSSYEMVAEMGTYFREKVLLAIGELQDEPHNHGFISAGIISDEGLIYGDHLPVFTETVHQYHAIAKFKFHDKKAVKTFKDKQLELLRVPEDRRVPVIFGNPNVMTLPDLMQSEKRLITMECFEGLPSKTNPAFMKTKEYKCYLS